MLECLSLASALRCIHALTDTARSRNQVALVPFTTRMAEVDRLSTSVSIRHTYFPPWLSWMLRIIRSPEKLYNGKTNIKISDCLTLESRPLLKMRNISLHNRRGRCFLHFFGEKQTWQMSPEQKKNLLAALQAPPAARPPPPTQHKQPPALQDTKDKHSLVNWQDNPNYSLITQAQTREWMSKNPSRKSKYYYREES